MNPQLVRVAVEAPIPEALTYKFQDPSFAVRGQSVLVPLGKRRVAGVVVGTTDTVDESLKLKSVLARDEERPTLPPVFLDWLEWLSDYYLYPIGQVLSLAFPPLSNQRKRKSKKAPVVAQVKPTAPPTLTPEQSQVLRAIESREGFQVHLLFGVTGSGKTEVYLRLLEKVLREKKQALVLVPEISLTPQLIDRFASRYGDSIAVLHSHLTEREKTDQWWSMVSGQKQILIGARSALFCPLPNLGLIVIDEEHEPSFKQDEKLKYSGRDAAIMLAKKLNCPIVLGSATPSLETWHHAFSGRYQLHRMGRRVGERQLPKVEVLDLRQDRRERREMQVTHDPKLNPNLPFWLSHTLFDEISQTLDKKEQVALFLNRRGVAQSALCGACGHRFECPNCSISLTVHGAKHLVCHYCDYSTRLPEHCPQCKEPEVRPLGLGTELLESDLRKLFPEARIARADRDEIQSREELEDLIRRMENREIDILVGTQMIAKGLDFPGLTLVGVVMADVGFSMPDFRASERSFQLMTQVAGRAGRHSAEPGRVVIQTYNPDHPAIQFTTNHDFEGFAQYELQERQDLHYSPFSRLALFRIQGPSLGQAEDAARLLSERARRLKQAKSEYANVQVLGPAPAPIAKLRGKFRFQALVKCPDSPTILRFCRQLAADGAWLPSGTRLITDIDPLNML